MSIESILLALEPFVTIWTTAILVMLGIAIMLLMLNLIAGMFIFLKDTISKAEDEEDEDERTHYNHS